MGHLVAAVVCALLAGAAGWWVPRVIAAVPEPEPALDRESSDQSDSSPTNLEKPHEASVPEKGFAGSPVKPPPPPHPPKTPYTAIAALPRLATGSALSAAAAGALFGAVLGWDWALLFLVPFVPLGVALAVIDWHTRLLPTWLIAPAYPVVVLLVVVAGVASQDWHDLRRAGFGWLVIGGYYLLMWLISPRLMGYGDVRLSGLLGMMLGYLGWSEIVVGLLAPFLVQGVPSLVVTLVRRRRPVPRPFGPAMLVAAALVVALGPPIGRWYAGRLGL